jgi:predicted acylesterase/phospholipase RssA
MVTKNFLFPVLLLSLVTLVGCPTMQRRDQGGPASGQPTGSGTLSHPPRELLPVGVFLSPGGMRAYAQIGVLRALQKAQVPVVAIGGMEWGSIVAASFAANKSANQVEWEMMKLRREQLPTSGLLRKELVPQDPKLLFDFLRFAFGDRDLDRGALPVFCPTNDGDETLLVTAGKARDRVLFCAVLPPLYRAVEQDGKKWISGAVSPGDWVGKLKESGARYVIYVDVIGKGDYLAGSKFADQEQVRAFWTAVKSTSKQQHSLANAVIEVPLAMGLSDFDQRREAISAGERAGNSALNSTILKEIGVSVDLN